jgi:hypothetical protein
MSFLDAMDSEIADILVFVLEHIHKDSFAFKISLNMIARVTLQIQRLVTETNIPDSAMELHRCQLVQPAKYPESGESWPAPRKICNNLPEK